MFLIGFLDGRTNSARCGIPNKDEAQRLRTKATGYWYDLYYDGNLIDRFILVAVDGARASLPSPDWQSGKVHMMDYKVAKINDTLKTVDQYLARSGLEVDENT